MLKILSVFLLIIFGFLVLPHLSYAHEVYVLNSHEIGKNLQNQSINVFTSLNSFKNILWLLFFASLAVISLTISFFVSFSKWGISMTKRIEKLKKFSFPIIRIVFGISLIASANHNSLFGPELPLSLLPIPALWTIILFVGGVLVIIGLFTRIVAVILLSLFVVSIQTFHAYMATYINYLGEILVLLLIGGENFSLDRVIFKKDILKIKQLERFSVPILRISFGLSLLFAALYAKFFHATLSHQVITKYHLTQYFPFDPLFIVLGAGFVEITIALLLIFGVNMRWNLFFFAFWATLSLLFFGETIWPHYILFGIAIGLFLYGYDTITLEGRIVKLARKLRSTTVK